MPEIPLDPPFQRLRRPLRINDTAPDFTAETTQGPIRFHDWIANSWVVFFSHAQESNPVSITELGYLAGLQKEFAKRNCKIIGLSANSTESFDKWVADIEQINGQKLTFPVISDPELSIAETYNMLPAISNLSSLEPDIDLAPIRTIFVIGPDAKIKTMPCYPMNTGRNSNEVLRLIDSLQITSEYNVATPANWKLGDDVIISGVISNEQAKRIYPGGWKTLRPYLRMVREPKK